MEESQGEDGKGTEAEAGVSFAVSRPAAWQAWRAESGAKIGQILSI